TTCKVPSGATGGHGDRTSQPAKAADRPMGRGPPGEIKGGASSPPPATPGGARGVVTSKPPGKQPRSCQGVTSQPPEGGDYVTRRAQRAASSGSCGGSGPRLTGAPIGSGRLGRDS